MNIFTDGAAWTADGSAGYGFVAVLNNQQAYVEFDTLPPGTTSNQAELIAILRALEGDVQLPVTIYCDNRITVDSHNVWAQDWLTRELRRYGVATFHSDTVLDLYRMLKHTTRAPLELVNSNGDPIKNLHLWDAIWGRMLQLPGDVSIEWVPGHQERDWSDPDQRHFWNDLADNLAKAGREKSYSVYNLER